jgi:hypothetical protein
MDDLLKHKIQLKELGEPARMTVIVFAMES